MVENGVIYHGLLTGKVVGAISSANTEARSLWEPVLQTHANIIMPDDAARILVYDCFVSAIQGMVAFGLTMPFSGADGLRHATVVTLEDGNPLNYLYHEAAHLLLREGRISADEFAFYREAATVAQLGERYQLERYGESRRPEEALAHLCGEWGAGADSGGTGIGIPAGGTAAGGYFERRGIEPSDQLRSGGNRPEIIRSLGLPDAAVRFLNEFVTGEVGRRPADRAARLAWLQEMGIRPANEHLFGRHPAEIGLARSAAELARKPLNDFKGWRRRADRDRAAEQLCLLSKQLGGSAAAKLRASLSPEDLAAWDSAQARGRARGLDLDR